jgi:hypothetical protein
MEPIQIMGVEIDKTKTTKIEFERRVVFSVPKSAAFSFPIKLATNKLLIK